jgi:hypothetical protein
VNHISTNQTIAPVSTLNVPGLFRVGIKPTKLADLTNGAAKLTDLIPQAALTISLRNAANHTDNLLLVKPDGSTEEILPQQGVELTVADLATYSISADSDRGAVAFSYERLMGDKA